MTEFLTHIDILVVYNVLLIKKEKLLKESKDQLIDKIRNSTRMSLIEKILNITLAGLCLILFGLVASCPFVEINKNIPYHGNELKR